MVLLQEIWNVEDGRLTHKGKAAVIDSAFESNASSALATPAGSGDEVAAVLDGADAALSFKAVKGRKKMTRKQLKDREERRRLRTGAFFFVLLPSSVDIFLHSPLALRSSDC